MAQFAYTIVYVPDVAASLAFFEKSLGLPRKFMTAEGDYGELSTGQTTLALASRELAAANLGQACTFVSPCAPPVGMELAFVTDDIGAAHRQALDAGAQEVTPPAQKPWGQWVSYLRCPDGILLELCTPMGP